MRKQIIFLILILCSCTCELLCQEDTPADLSGSDDADVLVDAAPVDGGISLLIAAGAVYGIRQVTRRKKQTQVES